MGRVGVGLTQPEMLMKILFTIAVLVASVGQVRAGFISIGDAKFGADSVTLDTETGLEWLDITQSTGLSYSIVMDQFASGGVYEGFRYATELDVITFFDHAGVRNSLLGSIGKEGLPASFESAVEDFMALTGFYNAGPPSDRTLVRNNTALYDDGDPADDVSPIGLAWVQVSIVTGIPDPALSSGIVQNAIGINGSSPTQGNWLVRDTVSPVPEPSSLVLLVTGAIGLIGYRRRKRKMAA